MKDLENESLDNKYLEKNEIAEFLNVVKLFGRFNDLEMFYLFIFSGMRSGELCALQWNDINFETNDIRINKTLYTPRGNMREYKLTPSKTKGSTRTFDIDGSVIALIKAHKLKQIEAKNSAISQGIKCVDSNFVISRINGHPYTQRMIYIRMQRIIRRTSIKKNATPHIFRHTH
ncbi:site-specific integrase [Paenibacillus sp. FSL K6-3182]|uniref:site-specific integrase n=1 Tax=Paenibacillus sp. FSL K6-3182 TaxID=2921495 RepID=UPI0030CC398C